MALRKPCSAMCGLCYDLIRINIDKPLNVEFQSNEPEKNRCRSRSPITPKVEIVLDRYCGTCFVDISGANQSSTHLNNYDPWKNHKKNCNHLNKVQNLATIVNDLAGDDMEPLLAYLMSNLKGTQQVENVHIKEGTLVTLHNNGVRLKVGT